MLIITQNIRYLRKKHKWSQGKLADKLNCNVSTIKHWESGQSYPTFILLLGLEEVFGVNLNDLAHTDIRRLEEE